MARHGEFQAAAQSQAMDRHDHRLLAGLDRRDHVPHAADLRRSAIEIADVRPAAAHPASACYDDDAASGITPRPIARRHYLVSHTVPPGTAVDRPDVQSHDAGTPVPPHPSKKQYP